MSTPTQNEPATSSLPTAAKQLPAPRTKIRGYLLLLSLSVIWGVAFVAIRRADFELSPVNLTILRWLIASAGFLTLVPFIGRPRTRFERNDLPRLIAISFANVAGYHLSLNYAESAISAGLAGLLVSLGPVLIVALSVVMLKEKAGPRLVLALILATLGAFVLSAGDLGLGSLSSLYGALAAVLSAFSFATFSVLSKPLVGKYGAPSVTIWAGLIGTAMLVPLLSWGFVEQVSSLSAVGWFSVLYLALLSTVIGYILFYTLVSRSQVSRLSVQLYLIPIISVVGGALLLGEAISVFTIIGGAAMLLAVAVVTR